MQTAEGTDRAEKAMSRFSDLTAQVANTAEQFLRSYRYVIAGMLPKLDLVDREDVEAALAELDDAIALRRDAQDEMLFALSGRPNPKGKAVA
jgi:BMFP domain-containing protein YqiC